MTSRLAAVPALAVLVVALLTGCGPGSPDADDTTSPSPRETVVESESPTPTPTPDAPAALTCESIVDPATYTALTTGGYGITDPDAFAAKLASEGNALAAFGTAGGILCQAGQANSEAIEIYGYAPLTAAQVSALGSQFTSEGYTEEVTDAGILYRVPADTAGLPRVCYARPDAFTICGEDDARLDEIVARLGL